jgi:two-component system chemotaxis response regulator CheY
MLAEVLEAEGYIVETAINGWDALARVRNTEPVVIVTDLMMPIMDGWTFIRQFRAVPSNKFIPVIMMSADIHAPERQAEHRVQAFFGKPFDFDLMLRAIARAITSYRRRRCTPH